MYIPESYIGLKTSDYSARVLFINTPSMAAMAPAIAHS
jgi:hypothetical protein